ncbi:MAG: protein kinase [Planctomycetota bacterium]|nr:protein kinase [Planctomycetota bacterium]
MNTESSNNVLLDQLAEEFTERLRRGERPSIAEYVQAHADLAEQIRELFQTIASVEHLGTSAEPPLTARDGVAPGTRLGHFRILRLIGEGGMGAVYLAEDEELQKQVAIKIPFRRRFRSDLELAAILDEARTVARLEHTAIVPVHYFGREPDGTCYLVMKYMDGPSLAERLRGGPFEPRQAAELMATIAEAVGYIHGEGFVHRDLKPQNILFDAARRPYVADFGLALHESVQRRLAGDRSGTLRYMAPEQIRGEAQWLDGRADVWALGAIFYELLTGQHAFASEGAQELAEEIQRREPRPPRQHRDSLPAELERICLKCLAKDATRRYATAGDLAADLRRWLRPRSRRTSLLTVAGAILVLSATVAWFFGTRPGPSALPALTGTADILVWNPAVVVRRGLRLQERQALPLRFGDQIRVEARLNRPAYVYLVWIDSQGVAWPVYPWTPGDWTSRPARETPLERLALPAAVDEGWPLHGPRGMETLLLLARDQPLPAAVQLDVLFANLPRQSCQDPQALVWFENGRPVAAAEDGLRGPQFSNPLRIDDPVLQTQELLCRRLEPYFSVLRAVSAASQGE